VQELQSEIAMLKLDYFDKQNKEGKIYDSQKSTLI